MAWTEVQKPAAVTGKSATFASAPTAGNLLICLAVALGPASGTMSKPTGWTEPIANNPNGTNPGIAVWWKKAGAGESSTVTWAGTSTSGITQIIEVSGQHATTPFTTGETLSATGTSTSPASGTLTTAAANRYLLAIVASLNTTAFTSWTNSFTEIGQIANSTVGRGGFASRLTSGSVNSGATAGSAAWRATQIAFTPAANAYTLTATQASFAETGETAGLKVARTLGATQASFALTGNVANLDYGRRLAATQASYSLTLEAAILKAARTIAAAQASIALTGETANLLHGHGLTASQASFSLSGQLTGLLVARTIGAGVGSISVSGQTESSLHGYELPASYGSVAVTANAAALVATRTLPAAQAALTLTGEPAAMTRSSSSDGHATNFFFVE